MNLSFAQRLAFLAFVGATGSLLIVLGLFDLQIVNRNVWDDALEHRSYFRTRVLGRRGEILDARGELLARDKLGYNLMAVTAGWAGKLHQCRRCGHRMSIREKDTFSKCPRCRLRDSAKDGPALEDVDARRLGPLAALIGWSPVGLAKTIKKLQARNVERVDDRMDKVGALGEHRIKQRRRFFERQFGWQPLRVKTDISYEAMREVILHPERNPAFRIEQTRVRRNVGGNGFAQLIGRKPDPVTRAQGMVTGFGLEGYYDTALRGEPGFVDKARDRKRPGELVVVHRQNPIDGVPIQLTIARRDQEAALAALDGKPAALVVLNAETGAVLVFASSPSYDPDNFNKVWRAAQKRAERKGVPAYDRVPDPRQNRALRGWYAPGSTMKPFTALAGLTFGAVSPDESIECQRTFHLDGRALTFLRCNKVHGETRLHKALAESCNVYFQTVMHRMLSAGAENHFRDVAHAFGFGEPTGLELENAGWMRRMTFRLRLPAKTKRPPLQYGPRLQHGIGQGLVTATPAQVARAYAALMTGYLPELHLVARRGSRRTAVRRQPVGVPEALLEPVREALRTTNDPGRKLAEFGLDRYELGCKTGTAQTEFQGLHTAWLAGFGEARGDRPAIAFAVVVEFSTDSGAGECAPRLKRFFDFFYGGGGRPQ